MENQNNELESIVNELQDKVEDLENTVLNYKNENEYLQKKVNDLQDKVNDLESDVDGLNDEIYDLESKIDELEDLETKKSNILSENIDIISIEDQMKAEWVIENWGEIVHTKKYE